MLIGDLIAFAFLMFLAFLGLIAIVWFVVLIMEVIYNDD